LGEKRKRRKRLRRRGQHFPTKKVRMDPNATAESILARLRYLNDYSRS
jgi:hypothetical protein